MSRLKKISDSQLKGSTEDLTLAAEETSIRIKSLLAKLEGGDSQNSELLAMKDSMDILMGTYFESHMDLDTEMNSLLENLRKGLISNEELEQMLKADQNRSGFVLRMAGSLKGQLESLFDEFRSLLDNAYKGNPYPKDQVNTLYTDMNTVLDSVDFISRVVSTPALKLNEAIDQVDSEMRTQVEIVLSRQDSHHKIGPHSVLKNITDYSGETFRSESERKSNDNTSVVSKLSTSRSALDSVMEAAANAQLNPEVKKTRLKKSKVKEINNNNNNKETNEIVSNTASVTFSNDMTVTVRRKSLVSNRVDASTQTDNIVKILAPIKKNIASKTIVKSSKSNVVDIPTNNQISKSQKTILKPLKLIDSTTNSLSSKSTTNQIIASSPKNRQPTINSVSNSNNINNNINNVNDKPSSQVNTKHITRVSVRKPNNEIIIEEDSKILNDENEVYIDDNDTDSNVDVSPDNKRKSSFNFNVEDRRKSSHPLQVIPSRAESPESLYNEEIIRAVSSKHSSRPTSVNKPEDMSYEHVYGTSYESRGSSRNKSREKTPSFINPFNEFEQLDDNLDSSNIDNNKDVVSNNINSNNESSTDKSINLSLDSGLIVAIPKLVKPRSSLRSTVKSINTSNVVSGARASTIEDILTKTPQYKLEKQFYNSNSNSNRNTIRQGQRESKGSIRQSSISNVSNLETSSNNYNNITSNKQRDSYITNITNDNNNNNNDFSIPRFSSININNNNYNNSYKENRIVVDNFKDNYSSNYSNNEFVNESNDLVNSNSSNYSNNKINNNQNDMITNINNSINYPMNPTSTISNNQSNNYLTNYPTDYQSNYSNNNYQSKYSPDIQTNVSNNKIVINSGNNASKSTNELIVIFAPLKKDKETTTKDFDEYIQQHNLNNKSINIQKIITNSPNNIISSNITNNQTSSSTINIDSNNQLKMSNLSDMIVSNSIVLPTIESTANHHNISSNNPIANPANNNINNHPNIYLHDITKSLQLSSNPLLTIYQYYKDYLPDDINVKLIHGVNSLIHNITTENEIISHMFTELNDTLKKIYDMIDQCIDNMNSLDNIISNMIILSNSNDNSNMQSKSYQNTLLNISTQLGELESTKLWIDINLIEYRSIFENFNKKSIDTIKTLLNNNKQFNNVYNLFMTCQGKSVELHNLIISNKERCTRHNLILISNNKSNKLSAQVSNQSVSPNSRISSNSKHNYYSNPEDIIQLRSIIEDLQVDIESLQDENGELNKEIFELLQVKDKTPSSLLYFTILSDNTIIPTIQQLIFQLKELKSFVNVSKDTNNNQKDEFIDYVTLKNRIHICISSIPMLDKLIRKYFTCYNKYISNRLEVFSSRNLAGGNADNTYVCPLCFNDARLNSNTNIVTNSNNNNKNDNNSNKHKHLVNT